MVNICFVSESMSRLATSADLRLGSEGLTHMVMVSLKKARQLRHFNVSFTGLGPLLGCLSFAPWSRPPTG